MSLNAYMNCLFKYTVSSDYLVRAHGIRYNLSRCLQKLKKTKQESIINSNIIIITSNSTVTHNKLMCDTMINAVYFFSNISF